MGPLVFKNCYFEETRSYYAGGIYINWASESNSDIIIEGCRFNNTKASLNGFAIMIQNSDSNTVTISGCYFIDCTDNSNYFAVSLTLSNLNFNYNTMTYSDPSIGGGCLLLEKAVNCNFNGNLFQNYKFDDSGDQTDILISGGVHCFKLEGLTSFKFINNTFDNALGNNQGRCIHLSEIPSNLVTFENNTIKNSPTGGPLIFLRFTNAINEFTIRKCNFINNTFSEYWDNQNDAQLTPQFWIENPLNDNYGVKLDLKFDQCFFEQNVSPREGGAIHFGKRNSFVNTKVIFQTCEFHKNNANKGGSAIFIETHHGCEINDCKFIKNRSEEGYGTINVKTEFSLSESRDPTLLITGSTFEENECKEGHAIYLAECTFAIKIMKCTFIDCGKNDYVISIRANPQSVLIENNTIYFTIDEQTASSLFINTECFALKENIFQNIKNTVVRSYGRSDDEKGFEIIDNTFSKCSGESVIDHENLIRFTPLFKGNTFIDISVLSQLMSIKLSNSIYEVSFDNNTFQNFAINSHYGGIGLEVDHESEVISISLSFKNCFFINNNNKESEQKGSAISCDRTQNSGNLQLIIEDCFFEKNHNEGKGCAIYANIKNFITIDNCIFKGNIGSEKGSIYIVPYDQEISQIPIVIKDCKFYQNQVNDYSSIYVEPGLQRSIKVISCIFDNEKGAIVLNDFKSGAEISDSFFINTQVKSALVIKHYADSDSDLDKIAITGCTFDSCTGIDNKCFDIFSNTRDFKFENNIIKNNVGTGHANYFGSFDFNKKISTFEVFNVSFINNVCNSLYGGGIGIQFLGIEQLIFNKCEFKENGAKQDNTKSRPTQNADQSYYNGDGGAIQLGYICTMNSLNVNFYECNFSNNHAQRHGGAIAIQTSMIVKIDGCIFESNLANYNFEDSSANLLTENHFHKKFEGRGGAIYINPSYTYDDTSLNCKSPDHPMQSVEITNCEFTKNNGFDGYAIYIEGDDINVPFNIKANNFIDNYNKNNHNDDEYQIYGAVITTELTCIKEEQINTENTFSYSIPQLKVRNISYVDHYGKTPSSEFTRSEFFTQSDFIPTNTYTSSHLFSESSGFSNTNDFSNTLFFSRTKGFSETGHFSSSKQFSATNHFTKSEQFTSSNLFSRSQFFTDVTTDSSSSDVTTDSSSSDVTTDSSSSDVTTDSSSSSDVTTDSSSSDITTDSSSSSDSTTDSSSSDVTTDSSSSDSTTESSSSDVTTDSSSSSDVTTDSSSSDSTTESSSSSDSTTDSSSEIPVESSSSEVTEPPSEPKCKVYEEGTVAYLNNCKYSHNSNGNKFVYIYVLSSNFTGSHDTNGGAININYCGIHCNNTCFIDCVAQSGGGGAMYIKNPINIENNATFIDLLFLRCIADYGGAIYHYSDSELFDVIFTRCHFEKNKALLTKPSKGEKDYLFGGSAIFLTCKNSLIQNCTFVRNLNKGAVKIHNVFENNYKSIGLDSNKNKISIHGCNFEQDKNSKSSIFYDDKKDGSTIEIFDCNFKGKLQKGSHYIDGEINVKEKIHVSSCYFENDNDDVINYKLIGNDEFVMKKINSANIIIFVVIAISLMIMLIIFKFSFLLEKSIENKSSDVQDQVFKFDSSNESLEILL